MPLAQDNGALCRECRRKLRAINAASAQRKTGEVLPISVWHDDEDAREIASYIL